ncbi:PAS domain-containing sensor histidine kinase [Aeoliella sp.]|uniref:PAS domain-containing sensor histidine kinase n=1 Tax=Aeoliella sp. TaxID=2795800 RepID=UPI003CCB9232
MTPKPIDKSARRVVCLVWLMAVVGVVAGAVVLTDVSLRLSSVRVHREQTELARDAVSSTLDDLRSYRLSLLEQLGTLQLQMLGGRTAGEGLSAEPLEFDQSRVDTCSSILRARIAELGGSKCEAVGGTEALAYGLEQTHRSLQEVWRGTTRAEQLMQYCGDIERQVDHNLHQLSAIVARVVGLTRLQVAKQLASLRRAEQGDRIQQLERLVGAFRGMQQPLQLQDDLRELALDTERLFALDDVDALRSFKDNRIRQTLSRLRRNSARLGEDADKFVEELDSYQHHVFGAGSRDDKLYQMLFTTDDGYYEQKVHLIENLGVLRREGERAEQAARACQSAEREMNRTVAARYTDATSADSHLLDNASRALYVLAGGASVMFLAASWWIVGLISRAMQQSQERQRESLEMAKIIRESPTEVYICDLETLQFIEVNCGACDNLGYSQEEMQGMTPVDLNPNHRLDAILTQLRTLEETNATQVEIHTEHYRKDGSRHPVQVIVHRSSYHDRPVYVAFVTDLTQVRQLEKQLAQAQKLESIGQMAAGLAHEINTPMQFVHDNIEFVESAFKKMRSVTDLYQQVLSTDEEIPWRSRRAMIQEAVQLYDFDYYCQEIVSAVQETREGVSRVVEIARAMKQFSHPGAKEKTLSDINDVIKSTATISRNRWKYTAELQLELGEDLPGIPLLVSEMNQVLLNLVVNASDAIAERFANEHDALGTITIRSRAEDDGVVVEVEDNGGGIPEEIRDSIFDPFFTTKEVGRGTGQGLSISHNVVVNQHGGRIGLESTPGVGTTFTIWLPIHQVDMRVDKLVCAEEELEEICI